MKVYLILFFLIFLRISCFSQDSRFYNNKGQFIADTNLMIEINPDKYSRIMEARLIANILDGLTYSPLLYENGISGKVIVKCSGNEDGILSQLNILNYDHPQLIHECISAINHYNKSPRPLMTNNDIVLHLSFQFRYGQKEEKKFKNGSFIISVLKPNFKTH